MADVLNNDNDKGTDKENDKAESNPKVTAANNRAGFWIMVVIIAGALYVGVSPFLGAYFQYKQPISSPVR